MSDRARLQNSTNLLPSVAWTMEQPSLIRRRWTRQSVASLLLLMVSSVGCAHVDEFWTHHWQRHSFHSTITETHQGRYYHCPHCGQIVPREGFYKCPHCLGSPAYHGYQATCWRQFPEGWGCPPESVVNNPDLWQQQLLESPLLGEPLQAPDHDVDVAPSEEYELDDAPEADDDASEAEIDQPFPDASEASLQDAADEALIASPAFDTATKEQHPDPMDDIADFDAPDGQPQEFSLLVQDSGMLQSDLASPHLADDRGDADQWSTIDQWSTADEMGNTADAHAGVTLGEQDLTIVAKLDDPTQEAILVETPLASLLPAVISNPAAVRDLVAIAGEEAKQVTKETIRIEAETEIIPSDQWEPLPMRNVKWSLILAAAAESVAPTASPGGPAPVETSPQQSPLPRTIAAPERVSNSGPWPRPVKRIAPPVTATPPATAVGPVATRPSAPTTPVIRTSGEHAIFAPVNRIPLSE